MAKGKVTKYRVVNPHGFPEGTVLISWQRKDNGEWVNWFEGDAFTPYPEMKLERLLREGWLEVADG